jgi:phospholipid transport system substrate-binding protein
MKNPHHRLVSAFLVPRKHLSRFVAYAMLVAVAGMGSTWDTSPALAAPAPTPQALVTNVANQAINTMRQSASASEREARFTTLLKDDFDVPRIARFVLGKYWASASEQERKEFGTIFEAYLARAYSNRFGEYEGETVSVTGLRSEGNDSTIVSSEIVHQQGRPPVKLEWRIYKSGDDYRILDVSVAGISMVLTHKQEFASIMEHDGGGVAGLIRTIQMKLHDGSSAQR